MSDGEKEIEFLRAKVQSAEALFSYIMEGKLILIKFVFMSIRIPFGDIGMNLRGNYCMIIRVDYGFVMVIS